MKYQKLLTNFFKERLLTRIIVSLALIGTIFLSLILFYGNTPGLATLVINLQAEKRFFEGEVLANMTMLDALNAAVSVGKIKFNYAIDKSGNVNVVEIDGHANGIGGKNFVFSLNSKKVATKDLNRKKVNNRDRIEILQ